MPNQPSIAFIGLGVMAVAILARLLERGELSGVGRRARFAIHPIDSNTATGGAFVKLWTNDARAQ